MYVFVLRMGVNVVKIVEIWEVFGVVSIVVGK